jgi:hypothetical protein
LLASEAWFAGAIVAAAVLVVAAWYRTNALIWGNDASFPLNARLASSYFHIPDPGLGAPDVRKLPFIVPAMAALRLWDALGLPYEPAVAQRCLVVALVAISGLSVYALVRLLFRRVERLAAFVAALFYMFNLYSLTWIWQSLSNLIFHYSLLPLVLVLWFLALRRRSIVYAVVAAVVWALCLTPVYVTTPIVLTDSLLFGVVVLTELLGAPRRKEKFGVLKSGAVLYAVWLGLNLFWIIPLFAYSAVVTARGLDTGNPADLFALNSVPFNKALRLAGYWGVTGTYGGSPYYSWRSYYLDAGVTLAFAVPAVAALAFAGGFLRVPRSPVSSGERRYVVLFTLILIASLVLVTGPRAPFGGAKEWLLQELHLLGPFRSTYQRFAPYAVLAYAPLVAVGVSVAARAVRGWLADSPHRNVAGRAVAGAIAVLVLLPALPLLTGSAFDASGITPSRRITIPPTYDRVASTIDGRAGDFAVLSFPFGKAGSVTALSWRGGNSGYLGVEPFNLLTAKAQVVGDAAAPWISRLAQDVARGGPRALAALRLLDARYVIVHLDADRPYVAGIDSWIGSDVDGVAERLDRSKGLVRVPSGPGLAVYEARRWKPFRLFAVRGYGGGSIYELPPRRLRAIDYRARSPFSFEVAPGQLAPKDLLVLNHPYDSSWRASGRPPVRVEPGLTGFRVADKTPVEVGHSLDRRFPVLLATFPLTLCLGAALALGAALRARR